MSFLFLLFPCIGFGVLTFGPRHGAQVAGFGREITLGGFGTIRDDPSVVLRVQVPARGTGVLDLGFAEHDHANTEIDASIAQYAEFAE